MSRSYHVINHEIIINTRSRILRKVRLIHLLILAVRVPILLLRLLEYLAVAIIFIFVARGGKMSAVVLFV